MTYKHPNAPLPAPGDVVRESNASVDQSKTFFGGQHHPWRRLFARTVDISTAGLVLFLLLIFAFSATMPEQAASFGKVIDNPIVASVVVYLIWLPAEALLLAMFGTTPAKWLFGIRVAHPGGDLLTVLEALNRSFLIFVQGVGFGIPFVALFTQLFAYRRLTKTGTTLWDTSANAVVLHEKWGVFRALACTAAVFVVIIVLNVVGKL